MVPPRPAHSVCILTGVLAAALGVAASAPVRAEESVILDFLRNQSKLRGEPSRAAPAERQRGPKPEPDAAKPPVPARQDQATKNEKDEQDEKDEKKDKNSENEQKDENGDTDKPAAETKPKHRPSASKPRGRDERPDQTHAALADTPPPYIRVAAAPLIKIFGAELADRILSHAFSPMRQIAIARSAKFVPGYACPDNPPVALTEIVPAPVKPATTSWIERYMLGCQPSTQRNFLVMLEDDKPQIAELLPGISDADPIMQRDAVNAAEAQLKANMPAGCDQTVFTNSRFAEPRIGADRPWTELWSFDQCGRSGQLEVTFTPQPAGGVGVTPKIIR